MKRPDVESIRRTLQRKGPNCDDFKDGMIRDLSKWTEDLLQYLEALKATQWQPIETAPKDGTPILAFCVDACDKPACDESSFCMYHAHGNEMGGGYALVQWGGAWDERTWEYPQAGYMPDWWFQYHTDYEIAANPIKWQPLPAPPESNP